MTCFCLFQSHNLASIFVPIKAKSLIISMVYFRGGQVMPKFPLQLKTIVIVQKRLILVITEVESQVIKLNI